MPLSLSAVNLITLTVGTLFYGIYVVLFSISLYLLLRRYNTPHTSHKSPQPKSIFRSTVFVSAICLFVVVTAHWSTIVYQAFIAFLAYQQGAEAEAFLNDHTEIAAIVQNSLMPIAILIGDCLIIHRLWVVWRSKLMLAIPLASLAGFTINSFISLIVYLDSPDVFANLLLKMNSLLTLLINVYCTVFITWKIWAVTKTTMPSDGVNLRHFVVIVIESAGLYAIWAVFFAVTYQVQSNLQSSVIQTAPELVGIVNALIHTRVGLGWTSEQTKKMSEPSSPLLLAGHDDVDG
ncbi:hypothetical protein C8R45DRAFT_1026811 [Mycena sanguinolenta]|nr:hypothetical protein C8R45DRAFT_1026811 [Mycena sanguinolenta]